MSAAPTTTAPDLRALAESLLRAVDLEMSPSWECNSYHPKLAPAAEALRAALRAQAPAAASGEAPQLSEAQIVAVWQAMPGGPEGWLKHFGFLQFAQAVLAAAAAQAAQPGRLIGWCVSGGGALMSEDDARAEAARCGGTARAMPLYTPAAPAAQPLTPKRFKVKKDAGSAFARVIDTEQGREVDRFNVVRRPDDWEKAERLCYRLNQKHEAQAAAAGGATGGATA